MSHPTNESTCFIVKLSQQQKQFISSKLPKNYSLQPTYPLHNRSKITNSKKFNIQIKEYSVTQKENAMHRKRKIKSYENIEPEQVKVNLNKRDEISKMINVVKKLKKSDCSIPFRMPFDYKNLSIHNYTQYAIIPMDLPTIEEKIMTEKYEHYSQIQRDINQMILNGYKFHSKNSAYFQQTMKFQQYYHSLLSQIRQGFPKRQIRKKEQTQPIRTPQNEKNYQISQFHKDLANLLKKSNQIINQRKVRQKPLYVSTKNDNQISIKQKRQLAQQIRGMQQTHLGRIVQIIKSSKDFKDKQIKSQNQIRNQNKFTDIFRFDVEKLDHKTFRELQNYVKLQKNSVLHDKEESVLESENVYSLSY